MKLPQIFQIGGLKGSKGMVIVVGHFWGPSHMDRQRIHTYIHIQVTPKYHLNWLSKIKIKTYEPNKPKYHLVLITLEGY